MESILDAPLEGEQKKLYEANLALIRESMRATPDMSRVVVLSMLTKLRQICCDPSLVYPDYSGNSAKTDACMELIETAVEGGHKIKTQDIAVLAVHLDAGRNSQETDGEGYFALCP